MSTWWLRRFYQRNKVRCVAAKWTYPSALKDKEVVAQNRLNFCLEYAKKVLRRDLIAATDETTVHLWM